MDIVVKPEFLNKLESEYFYERILNEVDWTQDKYEMYGKTVYSPRLVAYYGEKDYTYSGQTKKAQLPPEIIRELQSLIQTKLNKTFNVVLLNYYRNGQDSIAFHTDNEKDLDSSYILSLSLGATRKMVFKEIENPRNKEEYQLSSGDVVIMQENCQTKYQHSIPKTKKVEDGRINLTFRNIKGE